MTVVTCAQCGNRYILGKATVCPKCGSATVVQTESNQPVSEQRLYD